MLIRILLLQLCRSKAELRLMWRQFVRYQSMSYEDRMLSHVTDKRITRSLRLSLLWALFKNQIDAPHVVAIGLVGIGGLLIQGGAFVVRLVTKLVG